MQAQAYLLFYTGSQLFRSPFASGGPIRIFPFVQVAPRGHPPVHSTELSHLLAAASVSLLKCRTKSSANVPASHVVRCHSVKFAILKLLERICVALNQEC